MRKYIHALVSLILFSICIEASGQAADTSYAITNFSVNYLRLNPDYESPLETQELMGVPVQILETSGYWKKVRVPQPYDAWCTDMGLTEYTEEEMKAYLAAPKYICTALYSKVTSTPEKNGQMISDLVAGDLMRISFDSKGRTVRKSGYLQVILPDNRAGWVAEKDLSRYDEWKESRVLDFPHIRRTAMQFLGVPYLWGGMSVKGFDCSGLIRYVYLLNGKLLPRNASQQCKCGEILEIDPSKPMKERIAGLVPGDLVFFGRPASEDKKEAITHVALYLGDGLIIHSSHLVRINSLYEGSDNYYANSGRLIRACRIIPSE